MKKTKQVRSDALDAILTSAFGGTLLGVLTRQAVAMEALVKQNERSIDLQERQVALAEKGVRASQDIASVTKHAYAQRLMAAVRASTGEDETP